MEEIKLDVTHFADHYRRTFAKTLEACNAVPDDKWEWRPSKDMRSFRELVAHIVGNERAMSRGILDGDWDLERLRIDFPSREEAMSSFRKLHEKTVSGFSRMSNELFHQTVETPFGSPMTRADLALRMIEHEVHHRGSLFTYLALAEVERPGLYD